jgi:hypothetical protein
MKNRFLFSSRTENNFFANLNKRNVKGSSSGINNMMPGKNVYLYKEIRNI